MFGNGDSYEHADGKTEYLFETPPYIVSSASIVGKKEGEGPLGACFDLIGEDDKLGRTPGKRQRVPCRKRLSEWQSEKQD